VQCGSVDHFAYRLILPVLCMRIGLGYELV
jgi:hypothetical protein